MTAAKPSVSVIIPVFNGARTIARAIDSALAQRFDGIVEVIVVNDGSTDATAEILRGYGARISVIDQSNSGPARARNIGVENSRGEYIAFLDADDEWLPSKLAVQVPILEGDGGCVMVYSDALRVDEQGRELGRYQPPAQRRAPTLDEMLSTPWNILPSTAVIRRSAIAATGGFREEFGLAYPQSEDTWFMLMLREQGGFTYLDEPLIRYEALATAARHFERRGVRISLARARDSAPALIYATNCVLMTRLTDAHFGRRGRIFRREIRKGGARVLVGAGLTAMDEGAAAYARRCYLAALRFAPANIKTWLRIGWTLIPQPVASSIACRLPGSIARAFMGPPQA
jgi:glycosyltransferase involved in cell wall biosynthesis